MQELGNGATFRHGELIALDYMAALPAYSPAYASVHSLAYVTAIRKAYQMAYGAISWADQLAHVLVSLRVESGYSPEGGK